MVASTTESPTTFSQLSLTTCAWITSTRRFVLEGPEFGRAGLSPLDFVYEGGNSYCRAREPCAQCRSPPRGFACQLGWSRGNHRVGAGVAGDAQRRTPEERILPSERRRPPSPADAPPARRARQMHRLVVRAASINRCRICNLLNGEAPVSTAPVLAPWNQSLNS